MRRLCFRFIFILPLHCRKRSVRKDWIENTSSGNENVCCGILYYLYYIRLCAFLQTIFLYMPKFWEALVSNRHFYKVSQSLHNTMRGMEKATKYFTLKTTTNTVRAMITIMQTRRAMSSWKLRQWIYINFQIQIQIQIQYTWIVKYKYRYKYKYK